jgi:MoxR-like ATPase
MNYDLRELLHILIFTPWKNGRWGVPAVLVGPPGARKTSEVIATAMTCALPCETVIGSVREPTDIAGLPTPSADGSCFEYLPAKFLLRCADEGGRGILFLDEISSTPPTVQAAMMRGVLEGVFGDHEIPKGTRILGAMNPTDQAAGGFEIAAPMANRIAWYSVDYPSADEFIGFLMSPENPEATVDAQAEEDRVMGAWPQAWTRAVALVSGFLHLRPDLLAQMPAVGSPAAGRAWPSPRSWEVATRLLASSIVHGASDTMRDTLIEGAIGAGVSGEFSTYLLTANVADPYDILDGKIAWAHDPKRLDMTYAICAGIAACIVETHKSGDAKLTRSRADRAWRILDSVADTAKDVVVEAAKRLSRADIGVAGLPSAKPLIVKLHAYLAAAR